MDIKSTYIGVNVSLDRHELRLIGLGLCRLLKDKADIEAAKNLNQKLLEGRRRVVLEELDLVEGALEKACQEVGPEGGGG